MMHTLSDKRLAELRLTLIEWSEHPSHTNAFRGRCADCAGLIEAYLDGGDVKAECTAAIEEVFGPLANAEGKRLQSFNDLDVKLTIAAIDEDPKAWVEAMVQALPLMSEAQVLGVMDVLHDQDKDDPEPGVRVTPWVHDMPNVMQ